ncbi:MAG TPA: sigma 54-interacting transcriptional regulator [Bacteriovoracaceae bacterium]|nr:sigma 54-interacting transcriptional regulator [Bacteriovoracaceae bacterium]
MLTQGFALVGNHPKFNTALETARNVAVTKTPVLISGEAGSGKKALGAYIHTNSVRKAARLEVVDCSFDSSTVEKIVLGFRDDETGRFNRGVLEVANGGTVIFANIDALDESFQKRLYTILQELPDYELDVRILATTSKNLSKLVSAGKFSRALYTYFNGASIDMVALRERGTDVELIARHFISEYATEHAVGDLSLCEDAARKLSDYNWSQNLSELKTFIRKTLSNMEGKTLDLEAIENGERKVELTSTETDEDGLKLMSLKDAEKLLIKKALVFTSENRTQAAKILGVSIRTLRNKINEYRGEGTSYFINLR